MIMLHIWGRRLLIGSGLNEWLLYFRMMKSGRGAEYDAFDFVSSGEESEEEELPNESGM